MRKESRWDPKGISVKENLKEQEPRIQAPLVLGSALRSVLTPPSFSLFFLAAAVCMGGSGDGWGRWDGVKESLKFFRIPPEGTSLESRHPKESWALVISF